MYYVPNLGPSIYMTSEAEAWAERVAQKSELKGFFDLDKAKDFARRIRSKVQDADGTLVFDAASGELLWRREFADRYPETAPIYGSAMSPIVVCPPKCTTSRSRLIPAANFSGARM